MSDDEQAFETGKAIGRAQGQIEGLHLAAQVAARGGAISLGLLFAKAAHDLDAGAAKVLEDAIAAAEMPFSRGQEDSK